MTERVLNVVDLKTEFHLRTSNVGAVDGITFHVDQGECVGLVGESGCGKTTAGLSVMKLLPGVGHITGGRIELLGRDLVPLSERQMCLVRGNDVGMIFQDPLTSLNPTMRIGKQIAESVRLHRGVGRSAALERALEVLRLVEMPRPEERLNSYPHELSGGLRQRVMIAMALACDPKLLIADEPTTALDVTIQAQILDLIESLRERLGMAVILITHDMGVIASRTDRVMVMYAGKIVEEATTHEVFTRVRHPYADALLQSVPKLEQDASVRLYSIPGLPPDLSKTMNFCRFSFRCPRVQDDCRASEPPLEQAPDSSPGHVAACFHPVREGDRVQSKVVVADTAGSDRHQREIAAQPVVLRVERLVKEFPVTSGAVIQRRIGSVKAVSDVSFNVRRGETFGLVGESGCGKTTTGRLVVALERPNSGSIKFEDDDLTGLRGGALRRRRQDLQLMFQDPYASLDPRMRVGSILREPLKVQGIGSKDEQVDRVKSLLAEVGLNPKAIDLYPHEFSGGQRQRIGLARALTLEPKLIVADEPVSALDVSIQSQILNLLKDLQQRRQLTYILISHDLAVVKYMSDTIGVMYLGKMVEVAPGPRLYDHAAHPYTQALIDIIPEPDVELAQAKKSQRTLRGELPSAIDPPSGCRFRTRCPYAQEICAEVEPPLRAFGENHVAACHFPLQEPKEASIVSVPEAALAAAKAAAGAGAGVA